ncbi:MAG: hypothetical protein HFG40_01175 [Bacilli bacterium]|nr:hypothetical protein [Bacilli bacterium]
MLPYDYNMNQFSRNMYNRHGFPKNYNPNRNQDRFIGAGFVGPLLLGGIAGYAIGNQQQNNPYGPMYYPQPYYYPQYYPNTYYNNFYYYPY